MDIINQTMKCPACAGSGNEADGKTQCKACQGAGAVIDNRLADILKKHFPGFKAHQYGNALADIINYSNAKNEESFSRGVEEGKRAAPKK